MSIEAQMVSPLEQYYPTALLNEYGEVISVARLIPGGECLGSNEYKMMMIRQCKKNKQMANCQDFGLMCADKNGGRKVVIADGVSSTVGAQSVANLISYSTMERLNALDGQKIDVEIVNDILEKDNLLLACCFFRKKFAEELDEAVRLDLHEEAYVKNAERGHYGATTISFMRLEDKNLDIYLYGSGGYFVFRDGEFITSYDCKERRPPQIAVNGNLEYERAYLRSMKVQGGDLVAMFSDGVIGMLDFRVEDLIARMKKYLEEGDHIKTAIVKAYEGIARFDDKTLAYFVVT